MIQTFKRGLSFVLVLVMFLGILASVPFTALASTDNTTGDGYYNIISKNDYQLAPGIVESDLVFNNDEGSRRQVLHMVEVDINNPYTKVMPSYMGMKENIVAGKYSTATMEKQVAYAEANGYGNVVAAMNISLSWYNNAYYSEHPEFVGEPLGYLIMDGVRYENSRGSAYGADTCLVINFDEKDGVSRPESIPKVQVRLIDSPVTGWEEQVIPANFGMLAKDGKNLQKENHTSGFGPKSVVGVKADGTIVMAMCDGRQDPYSSGFNKYEITDYLLSIGCENVIQGDGGGSSQFLSQRPGEEMALHCSPSDGTARATTHGILVITTAPATGEFVRATVTTENKFYTPNSKIPFKAVGSDFVGTFAEIPEEAYWTLSDSSMGAIDENGVFTSNGKLGDVTAKLVYNDEVVGEASITIVVPEIALKTAKLVLPYGETNEIKLTATTNNGLNNVTLKDGDVVLTLSDPAMGTVNGVLFTATNDTTVKGGNLTAVACGDVNTTITIEVSFGKASEIAYDFEDPTKFVIDTSNEGGASDADETGVYYYGWHIADKGVTKYYGYRNHSKTTKNNSKFGLGVNCSVGLVDSTTGMVRNGNYAMSVDIDYSQVTSTGATQVCMWLPEPLDVSEATKVGMWVYFPDVENLGETMFIAWTGKKTTGKNANVNTSITIGDQFADKQGFSDEGWFYISIDVRANDMVSLEYLTFMSYETQNTQLNPKSDYTFYIDDITVDYSDAVIDRENPYFTNVYVTENDMEVELVDGMLVSSNLVSFVADVTENMDKDNYSGLNFKSVYVTVDGLRITDGVYVTGNGRIFVTDLKLSDGIHTIRFSICDEQGNEGSVVRKVVVNSKKGSIHFEIEKPNFANVPTGAVVYYNLIAENLSEIDEITTKIRLDGTSKWDLQGLEVAYGFTASWTVNANNEAFITITRVSDEVADTDVLAKIPLRAWVASAYLDPKYASKVSDSASKEAKGYILTPKALWTGGVVTRIHIITDVSEGIITYIDGSKDMFSSEVYELTTEMNKHHGETPEGFDDHTQGKTSFHIHKAGEKTNKAATCTEAGYVDRVFCTGCSCDTLETNGVECDTHNGCGSVVEWGTVVPATGHTYKIDAESKKLVCECGKEFTGTGLQIVDGKGYYTVNGKLMVGWITIDDEWYYFDSNTYTSVDSLNNGYVTFEFETSGKLVSGQWYHSSSGSRYYYGPGYYRDTSSELTSCKPYEIDGKTYLFNRQGYMQTGIARFYDSTNGGGALATDSFIYYDCGTDGVAVVYTGVYEDYFYIDGIRQRKYMLVADKDGNLYFINDGYKIAKNSKLYLSETFVKGKNFPDGRAIQPGTYYFDAEGKMEIPSMKNGVIDDRLYINDVLQKAYQLVEFEGNLYFINDSANRIAKNLNLYLSETFVKGKTFPDGRAIQPGTYYFDAEGKMEIPSMKNGVIDDRLYINDVLQKAYQLVEFEGNLYFINDGANRIAKNLKLYLSEMFVNGKTFPDGRAIQPGTYYFDAEGKMEIPSMKNGVIDDRLYINDVLQKAYQLVEFEGNLYFINDSANRIAKNLRLYLSATFVNGKTFPDGRAVTPGYYYFDAEGKMVIEPYKNGVVGDYLYINDVKQTRYKLVEFEGDFYFINDGDKVAKNIKLYLSERFVKDTPIAAGYYRFDSTGKMIVE